MRTWWPATGRPSGTANWPQGTTLDQQGRSGSITTTANAVITREKVCGMDYAQPKSVVVEVSVAYPSSGEEADCPAESDLRGGTIVLQYGCGQHTREVEIDLRSGTYQLPPCEQVRVLASTYTADTLVALRISGCLAEGVHPEPSIPTYTYSALVAAATPVTLNAPSGAKFVDCWISDGSLYYGAGAPRVSLYNVLGSQVVRDYANAIWAPPYPAALFAGPSSRQMTLATTVDMRCVVQFELEL